MGAWRRALWAAVVVTFAIPAPRALALSVLASDSAGHETLVAFPLSQRDRDLVAAVADPGSPFGPFTRLGTSWVESVDAAVAPDGTAFAAWKKMDPAGSEVGTPYAAVREAGAATFGRAVRLARGVPAESVVMAVNTNGDAAVGWAPDKGESRMTLRQPHSAFGPPFNIPGSTPDALELALDDDGGVLAVWQELASQPPPKDPIRSVAAAYRPPGGTFGPAHTVSGAPSLYEARFGANRHGDALLAWVHGTELDVAERERGGLFGAPVALASNLPKGSRVRHVVIADGGAALIAVIGNGSTRAMMRPPGGSFGAPEVIAASGASRFDVAIDDAGDAAAVWQDEFGPAVFGSFRPAAGAWQPAGRLSSSQPFAPGLRFPAVTIGANGLARATWEDDAGDHVDLVSRTFGPSPLSPPAVLRRVPSFVRDAPPSACTPSWARVLRRTRTADVIQSKNGPDRGELYGCLFARGNQVELSAGYEVWFRPSVAVAGPYAAVAGFGCDPDDCYATQVEVVNLRNDDSRFTRAARAGVRPAAQVSALRLRADGGVAWVSCPTQFSSDGVDRSCTVPSAMTKWVYEWGPHQAQPRLVASGRDVDPRTLRLHGRRVTWQQGGRTQSASVP